MVRASENCVQFRHAANQKYEDEVRVYYLKRGNNASNGCQHQFTELIAAHFCGTHYVEAALWKPCGHVKFKHLFLQIQMDYIIGKTKL